VEKDIKPNCIRGRTNTSTAKYKYCTFIFTCPVLVFVPKHEENTFLLIDHDGYLLVVILVCHKSMT
jgi:hypothetical protein